MFNIGSRVRVINVRDANPYKRFLGMIGYVSYIEFRFLNVKFPNGEEMYGAADWRFEAIPTKLEKALK